MAEAAGLAIGVVGIIGTFKDAIDLFNLFQSAKNYRQEYHLLETKLDIEKTLLLQWAARVRLLQPDYDERLDDETTGAVICRSLECIQGLLSDTKQLKERYGLTKLPSVGFNAAGRSDQIPRISDVRMHSFIRDFNALRLARTDIKTTVSSVKEQVCWAIQDQQKFTKLIGELDYFVDKLNSIVPAHEGNAARISGKIAMAQQDLEMIRDLRQLKSVIEASIGLNDVIADSAEQTLTLACQEHILNILWFRRMRDRKNGVDAAHQQTFQWSLEPPNHKVATWDDIPAWLQHSSGIYWMSGKAGSGKSTLMKYIYTHAKTRSLLESWSGGNSGVNDTPLHIYDFFFAHLGTDEQKSAEGFSRALLYQFLSDHKHLIQTALPNLWKEVDDSKPDNDPNISLPSAAEYEYAWKVLNADIPRTAKFCIFIDGLDELKGDNSKVISLIHSLSQNDNVKILVSSRPEPDCVAAFSSCPSLRLQDLTHADISRYVEDYIGKHEYVKRLERRYPEEVQGLKRKIIDKASGVFLWVILACRSLLRGFNDHDRLHELQIAVDSLPRELEVLFQHMLNRVSAQHREQGSRLLRICHANCLSNHTGDLYALGLALVEDYHMETISIKVLRHQDKKASCEELEARLRSRSGGLLEVSSTRHARKRDALSSRSKREREIILENLLIDSRVHFMHRTVFDFLCTDSVWEMPCLRITESSFRLSSALSLYNLQLAMQLLSLDVSESPPQGLFLQFLREGARWADREYEGLQKRNDSSVFFDNLQPLLDALSLKYSGLDGDGPRSPLVRTLSRAYRHHTGSLCGAANVLVAVTLGCAHYVRQHPSLCALVTHDRRHCGCPSLLYSAMRWSAKPSQMISLLLTSGSDPNERIDASETDLGVSTTPWLTYLSVFPKQRTKELSIAFLDAMDDFIRAGADLEMAADLETQIPDRYLHGPVRWESSVIERAMISLRLIRGSCNGKAKGTNKSKGEEAPDGQKTREVFKEDKNVM